MTGVFGGPLPWIGFGLFVLVMLAVDLGIFHRKEHVVTAREALAWSLVWVALALAFAAGVHAVAGSAPALEFLTGYVIEKALSVDNLFVFLVVFAAFRVPPVHQHRVLFWGVVGALLLRAAFVVAGAALLARFHWLVYVFGGFLVFTGAKLLVAGESHAPVEESIFVRAFRRVVPMTEHLDGASFIVRRGGRLLATPLLLVLVVVEGTDLIFALDSVPAVLAVSRDPFVVWSSNVFAILGLRSLYFLLAGAMDRFRDLKVGLALVLVFVGTKMAASDLVAIPVTVSLGVIVALVGGSIAVSFARTRSPTQSLT